MHNKQEIILLLFRDGKSISSTAREVGVCRETVRKYAKLYAEEKMKLKPAEGSEKKELIEDIIKQPKYDSSNRKRRKLTDEIISIVKECLAENHKKKSRGQHKQLMNKNDILEYVREQGHDIGYTTICELVNELEQKQLEAYIRQRYSPGDTCEFDWGEARIYIGGKLCYLNLAVFTSAYSNYRYSVLFPKQDTQSFQEAHAMFFDSINGAYRTLVYDNMKIAIRNFVGNKEKQATLGLLQLSTYYNFGFRFCNLRAGNEKGHVERSVAYVRQKAFARKDSFSSLEEANKYLRMVCERLNSKPQTANKNQTAKELFDTEKEYLLPVDMPFESAKLLELRVDKYSTISVDRCHYSVPEQYTGKIITAKVFSNKVICYYDDKIICKHMKVPGRDEWIINIRHYLKTLRRKPGAVANSCAFLQMEKEYRTLYNRHFAEAPKDFIELLIYQKEKKLSLDEIITVIRKLEAVCPNNITTDKVKTICERAPHEPYLESNGDIENSAVAQLNELANLIPKKDGLRNDGGVL